MISNIYKKYYVILLTILILLTSDYLSSSENYKWFGFTGHWQVNDSQLTQKRPYNHMWGYYEFINYNTLLSFKEITKLKSIKLKLKINPVIKHKEKEKLVLLSFAANSPKGAFFYDFYAFKLCGDEKEIHSSSLIQSRWKDPSKSFRTKYNYIIDTLATEPVRLAYDKMHTIRITMDTKKLVLFINKKKIISYSIKKDNYNGHLGFSVRNAYLAIDDVVVKDTSGNIILEDNFDTSSIYIRRVKGRIKSTPKE